MEDSNEWNECPTQVDEPGDRIAHLATIFWIKRASRNACLAMEGYRHRIAWFRRLRKQFKREPHRFKHLRINTVDELLADAVARRDFFRAELVAIGKHLFRIMQYVDSLFSFHDKCQVMGRDHRGVINQMERKNIPHDTRLSDLVTIYHLEHNGAKPPPLYSPAMPLYTAYHIFLAHHMIHNKELVNQGREMLEEMFPGMPWHEIQVDHSGGKRECRVFPWREPALWYEGRVNYE